MTTSAATDLDLLRGLNQAYLDSVRTGDVERFRQLLGDGWQRRNGSRVCVSAHVTRL
jgi:hypothetical protein